MPKKSYGRLFLKGGGGAVKWSADRYLGITLMNNFGSSDGSDPSNNDFMPRTSGCNYYSSDEYASLIGFRYTPPRKIPLVMFHPGIFPHGMFPSDVFPACSSLRSR